MTPPSSKRSAVPEPVPVMLTGAEYFRRKWALKLVFGAVLAIVLVGLAIWLGPKMIGSVKSWRARKLVEFAQVQKDAGNRLEMKNLLLQAYGLSSAEKTVLHAMASDYAESPAEALRFLLQLASAKDATREDKLKLCRAALDTRLVSFADREFQAFLEDPKSKEDPDIAELCARYLTLQGQTEKALAWTGSSSPIAVTAPNGSKDAPVQTPAMPSRDPRLSILHAKLLLDSIQPDAESLKQTAASVEALLWSAMNGDSESDAREAATLLGRLYVTLPPIRDVVDDEETQRLLAQLDKWSSDKRMDARLVAADLRIFIKPELKGEILDGLVKAESEPKDESASLELGRWLNARGETARTQALAEAHAGSEQTRAWYLLRLDAMAAEKKWAEIETMLMDPKGVPIEEALGRLFLWRCARELARPSGAIENLKNTVLDSGKKAPPDVDLFIAGYFEKFGESAAAATIYQRHTDDETVAGPAFVGLARCVGADPERTADFRNVLQQMLARFPKVNEARNDLAYINLLDGTKLNESIETAATLANEFPHIFAYRTTMALAELVRGNFQAAEDAYRNAAPEWKDVRSGWIAVRAAVAGANGKTEEAKKLLALIDKSALRSGERKLLEKHVPN